MAAELQSFAAIAGLILTLLLFSQQQRAANKAKVRDTYLSLELASNEVFRFEADRAALLQPYTTEHAPEAATPGSDLITENFYLQQLNLFEISARFRKHKIMEKDVFGSWVSWYYEVLTSWFFRERWPELRQHYTPDLRAIFDAPVLSFHAFESDASRRRGFFRHVAKHMNCSVIRDWVDKAESAEYRPKRSQHD